MKKQITEEQVGRINELYNKAKNEGLSFEEKKEQKFLRQEYINSIKANLRGQINNMDVQNKDGSITQLETKDKSRRK